MPTTSTNPASVDAADERRVWAHASTTKRADGSVELRAICFNKTHGLYDCVVLYFDPEQAKRLVGDLILNEPI